MVSAIQLEQEQSHDQAVNSKLVFTKAHTVLAVAMAVKSSQ